MLIAADASGRNGGRSGIVVPHEMSHCVDARSADRAGQAIADFGRPEPDVHQGFATISVGDTDSTQDAAVG